MRAVISYHSDHTHYVAVDCSGYPSLKTEKERMVMLVACVGGMCHQMLAGSPQQNDFAYQWGQFVSTFYSRHPDQHCGSGGMEPVLRDAMMSIKRTMDWVPAGAALFGGHSSTPGPMQTVFEVIEGSAGSQLGLPLVTTAKSSGYGFFGSMFGSTQLVHHALIPFHLVTYVLREQKDDRLAAACMRALVTIAVAGPNDRQPSPAINQRFLHAASHGIKLLNSNE